MAIGWSGYVVSVLHDVGIDLPARFASSWGQQMIQVPDAVADQLHMRHGWTALTDTLTKLVRG